MASISLSFNSSNPDGCSRNILIEAQWSTLGQAVLSDCPD